MFINGSRGLNMRRAHFPTGKSRMGTYSRESSHSARHADQEPPRLRAMTGPLDHSMTRSICTTASH